LRLGGAADRPGDGQGRGRLPALRALRRTMPDRRLGHAALHAGDDARGGGMSVAVNPETQRKAGPEVTVNDFVVKFANVNGSGSASANGMFAKAVLRCGVPVA